MADKNILAYFQSVEQAQAISSKLKALRAIHVQVENFSHYPASNPHLSSIDEGILFAADPSSNGINDDVDEGPSGTNILLTASVDESIYEQALRVIEEGGGKV
jgi:hypothetical protein